MGCYSLCNPKIMTKQGPEIMVNTLYQLATFFFFSFKLYRHILFIQMYANTINSGYLKVEAHPTLLISEVNFLVPENLL